MMIKHLSFDAWNTLLKPSKQYANRRSEILAELFGCSASFAKALYTSVKIEVDGEAERLGISYPTPVVVERLISKFPGEHEVSANMVIAHFEQAFAEFPPTILDEAVEAISKAKERGLTLSISSNTNFISGSVLGPMIASRIQCFDFMVFSDLLSDGFSQDRIAKPNSKFFAAVLHRCRMLHGADFSAENIAHIGDSAVCDHQGALSANFGRAFLVKGPEDVPSIILERL